MVHSKLAVEILGRTEHHLVKQHKDNNNGYAAYNYFCECYYGDSVQNEAAYSLRSNLEIYRLTSAPNTAQYIHIL